MLSPEGVLHPVMEVLFGEARGLTIKFYHCWAAATVPLAPPDAGELHSQLKFRQ